MRSKIIEVCQPQPVNWGKFIIAQFDEQEASHISAVSNLPLLAEIGYWGDLRTWLWVFDLQTGEGAIFPVLNRGGCEYELEKHRILVCPLYEPFLKWLYQNYNGDVDEIPSYLEIDAPASLHGYRRPGVGVPTHKALDADSLRSLAQSILNTSIKLALEHHHKDLAGPVEVFWELIRQDTAQRCRNLVEAEIIAGYELQEVNTNDIDGWNVAEQGFGKVFVLWLKLGSLIVGSDQTPITSQV